MKPYEIQVLRTAFAAGEWRSDPATRRTQVRAFQHASGTDRVELEPAEVDGGLSTVRILLRDDPADEWTVHADCKYRSSSSLILILVAYRLVSRRHSIDYRTGRSEALRDARAAVDRVW